MLALPTLSLQTLWHQNVDCNKWEWDQILCFVHLRSDRFFFAFVQNSFLWMSSRHINIVDFMQIHEGLIHFYIIQFLPSCWWEEGIVFVCIDSAQHMVHSYQQITSPSYCILQDCSNRFFRLFRVNFPQSSLIKGWKNCPFARDWAVGSKIKIN